MKLRFGKYKGEQLENTPKWYREWLLAQEWFSEDWEVTQNVKGVYNKLVKENKAQSIDGLIYFSDGLYMTEDGDMIEYDL